MTEDKMERGCLISPKFDDIKYLSNLLVTVFQVFTKLIFCKLFEKSTYETASFLRE